MMNTKTRPRVWTCPKCAAVMGDYSAREHLIRSHGDVKTERELSALLSAMPWPAGK